ncbi:MAG: hypothetical protein IT572_04600 [Deltaproteobacteria bacterium]|nr:hypothetical protein [Deltaproteobacteria bacterium]
MKKRLSLFTLFFLLSSCAGGLTGTSALDSPSSAGNSLDTQNVAELPNADDALTPISASTAAAPDHSFGNTTSFNYLPGPRAPRIAAAPGGTGILGAPVDDDKMGADCGRYFKLSEDRRAGEVLDRINETPWRLSEGKALRRKLLVSRQSDLPPGDVQIRVYYERPASASVQYRDYLLPDLGAAEQEIEIAVENPLSGDSIKVFYLPSASQLDPQDKLNRSCGFHRFDGFAKDWTEGAYAEYSQGPKDRIYVNQLGHFLIRILPGLWPDRTLKPALGQ